MRQHYVVFKLSGPEERDDYAITVEGMEWAEKHAIELAQESPGRVYAIGRIEIVRAIKAPAVPVVHDADLKADAPWLYEDEEE